MATPLGLHGGLAGALGRRVDPYLAINFLVEIDGLIAGGFSRVDGLESTIETRDYIEGGRNEYVHKILMHSSYPPIVLSHGLTDSDALWAWHDAVRRGSIARKNGTIMLLDTDRTPVMWWNFAEALPVRWVGPTFDASSDAQVAIERIELVHRGITKPDAGQLTSALRGAGSRPR
jgi:phage tail-like protein